MRSRHIPRLETASLESWVHHEVGQLHATARLKTRGKPKNIKKGIGMRAVEPAGALNTSLASTTVGSSLLPVLQARSRILQFGRSVESERRVLGRRDIPTSSFRDDPCSGHCLWVPCPGERSARVASLTL